MNVLVPVRKWIYVYVARKTTVEKDLRSDPVLTG